MPYDKHNVEDIAGNAEDHAVEALRICGVPGRFSRRITQLLCPKLSERFWQARIEPFENRRPKTKPTSLALPCPRARVTVCGNAINRGSVVRILGSEDFHSSCELKD